MKPKARTIIVTAIATLLIVILLQNLGPVRLRLVFVEFSPPMAALLAVFFGAGLFVGWFWRRR